ncbi:MAG: AAA family ATPase [Methanoregulaceae archaeon]|jgi:CO dehydrogenase maturation factor|nr:AAA family ATPase [Methanoregulaceae archaeon]
MITLAVTGKGGVGKTSIAAGLARTFARKGLRVIALDMDPSPNLWYSLGCGIAGQPGTIIPLISRKDFIEERTGAPPGASGMVFRINPKVNDVLEMFGVSCRDGVRLLVLGAIRTGGGGCYCPANTLARRLVSHLSGEADLLVMDMEAGVEHLGRGTTRSAQALMVIVEPGLKSVETAFQIAKMAKELGIPRIFGVINKLRPGDDPGLIAKRLAEAGVITIFAFPYDPAMEVTDRTGVPVIDLTEGEKMKARLLELAEVIEKHMLVPGSSLAEKERPDSRD